MIFGGALVQKWDVLSRIQNGWSDEVNGSGIVVMGCHETRIDRHETRTVCEMSITVPLESGKLVSIEEP